MINRMQGLDQQQLDALLSGLALLSQVFWGPSDELCSEMLSPDFQDDLAGLEPLLDGQARQAAQTMAEHVQRFGNAQDICAELEPTYIRLFVNAPGGVCAPLYHSCYDSEDGLLMGRPAMMMRRRLEEAGLDPGETSSEPPDHLAVELEYLTLLLDEAYERSDSGLIQEGIDFAGLEVLPWVSQLQGKLAAEDQASFYPAAARLLVALIALIAT